MNFRSYILIGMPILCSAFSLFGQVNIPIQNFSSSGTSLGAATNSGQHVYSVLGQPAVFNNNDPAAAHAGLLQLVNYIVVVIDENAPIINYSTPNLELNSGTSNSLSVQITDYNPIPIAKIFYRPISGDTFFESDLTRVSLGNYKAEIQSPWYDAIGMEYYFTAADAATIPNQARSPVTGNYYAYVKNPNTIFPISSFGASVSNYRIVADPYTKTNNTVSSLFDELGEYSNTKWRLATYQNASDNFAEYPADFTTLERGKGYWLIVKNTIDLSLDATTAAKENRESLHQLTISPGWNMIGNPYPLEISWDNVITLNNDPAIGNLQVFQGGWANAKELAPFQGGFVNYSGTSATTIKIPFKGQVIEGGRISKNEFSSNISSDKWKVDLDIFQKESYNKLGGFGMMPDAFEGKDLYDGFNPPRFLSVPEISFQSDNQNFSPALNIVKTENKKVWKLKIRGELGVLSELKWNKFLGENSMDLFLLDEENIVVTNMKGQNSYSFIQQNEEMDFKIYFGKNIKHKVGSDIYRVSMPYPNPVLRDQKVTFRLGLPESEEIYISTILLLDSKGVIARQTANPYSAGIHQIEMDMDVSPGLYYYIVKIVAGNNSNAISGKLIVR